VDFQRGWAGEGFDVRLKNSSKKKGGVKTRMEEEWLRKGSDNVWLEAIEETKKKEDGENKKAVPDISRRNRREKEKKKSPKVGGRVESATVASKKVPQKKGTSQD